MINMIQNTNKPANTSAVMMLYRTKGYTNAQIAAAMGTTYQNVYKKIGKQPHYMTCRSQFTAQNHRRRIENGVLRQKLSETKTELAKSNAALNAANAKLDAVRPHLNVIDSIAALINGLN